MNVTDEMVSRFLSWKLPANFSPDGGVRIDESWRQKWPVHWPPTGTNLLNADQARSMLRHVLGASEEANSGPSPGAQIAQLRNALGAIMSLDPNDGAKLQAMELIVRATVAPARDKAATIDAIHALMDTAPRP